MIGVYDMFYINSVHTPQKVAVIAEGQRYTYGCLSQEINRLAYGLHEIGVKKGTNVGMLFHNGINFITTFYALLKLGACISPLNHRCTAGDIVELLNIADCEYLLYGDELYELMGKVKELCKKTVCFISETRQFSCGSLSRHDLKSDMDAGWIYRADMKPGDEVLNLFTGGTTGFPKAAVHTHSGLIWSNFAFIMMPDYCLPNDIFLNYAPFFHIGGLSVCINIFSVGGCMVLTSKLDPDIILDIITKERVTQMFLIPPTICSRFLKLDNRFDLSSVRIIHLSGGASNSQVADTIFQAMPDVLISNAYGQSEHAVCLYNLFNKNQYEKNPNLINSVGKEDYFTQAKIVDEKGNEVPKGQSGEVWGKSINMLKQYRNREDTFINGWFATGDILRKDEEGHYYFLDRKKDMIKSGGENVYSIEVESAIKSHPAVVACSVVGLKDSKFGEIIAAAIVLHREAVNVTEEDIIDHCKRQIAGYKKPRKVFFLDSLPLSELGKVQKHILRNRLWHLCVNDNNKEAL